MHFEKLEQNSKKPNDISGYMYNSTAKCHYNSMTDTMKKIHW